MPFLGDPTWPAGLFTIFEIARAEPTSLKGRYHGPYNKLLTYCFGESFNYYVAPQRSPKQDSCDPVDFIFYFVVFDVKGKPVLLVEIKDDSWVKSPANRYHADKEMRDRYDVMLEDCSIPHLWGLSFLGTKMRVYCGNKESCEIHPEAKPHPDPSCALPSDFLAGEWNMDILSQEGFEKMKEVVVDIIAHAPNDE